MTTGELIKQRRIELGMTQEELASKMGFKTKASISRWDDDGLEYGDKYDKKYHHQKASEGIVAQGNLLEVLNILPTLTDKELELVNGMLALLLEKREHFHQ